MIPHHDPTRNLRPGCVLVLIVSVALLIAVWLFAPRPTERVGEDGSLAVAVALAAFPASVLGATWSSQPVDKGDEPAIEGPPELVAHRV